MWLSDNSNKLNANLLILKLSLYKGKWLFKIVSRKTAMSKNTIAGNTLINSCLEMRQISLTRTQLTPKSALFKYVDLIAYRKSNSSDNTRRQYLRARSNANFNAQPWGTSVCISLKGRSRPNLLVLTPTSVFILAS